MTNQPTPILTADQIRRLSLAQQAEKILSCMRTAIRGVSAAEIVELTKYLEGPDLKVALWTSPTENFHSAGYGPVGDDVPPDEPSEGWGEREDVEPRYTEPCCDEDRTYTERVWDVPT